MFGKKENQEMEQLKTKALEVVSQNAPTYIPYVYGLTIKEKELNDVNGLRLLGKKIGNTVYLNSKYSHDDIKSTDTLLHEYSHIIRDEIYGLPVDSHDEFFFKIYEQITGKPQKHRFEDGVKVL
jgi:hypothetical protein